MEQRVQKLETVLGSDPTHLVDNKLFLCICTCISLLKCLQTASGVIFWGVKSRRTLVFFCPQPGEGETGTSDVIPGLQGNQQKRHIVFLCASENHFYSADICYQRTLLRNALNNFSLSSGSDSEVSEMENYELDQHLCWHF